MRKKLFLLAILLVLLSGVTYFLRFRNSNGHENGVFVSGNIEATEVDLSFRISGQIITLSVAEGDRVQKDQAVATLDTDTLLAQKGSAEADIANSKAVLDELEAGTREEQIEAARASAKAAETRMQNAKDEYDRYLPLHKQGAISSSTFDQKDTAFKVAIEDYKNAAKRLEEAVSGPRAETKRAAKARLQKMEWDLKKIQLDVEHSVLTSPANGVVLVKANEIGEVVLPGATVATIAALDEVWLKGYIGEDQLGRVKHGQKVDVTTDTFPGKVYQGTVTFISSRAEFTPKNVQTREERIKQVYRVKITIPNPDYELKIGMPAEGYILTDDPAQDKGGPRADAKPAK